MLLNLILLETDTTTFLTKNWYYIAATLTSITGVIFAIKSYYKKNNIPITKTSRNKSINVNPTISSTSSPTNNINVNVNTNETPKVEKEKSKTTKSTDNREALIDSLKSKVQILFIDDDSKFNVVKILKDSGWKKTLTVTDIKSIDIPIIKESDIFFVDINGVGKLLGCEYEGLDIALMLKQKYPKKKTVIYSANKNNNAFHKAWDLCDYKLEKNALPYQFQGLVEQYSIELFT